MLVQADVVNLCQTQGPTVSRELPGTKSYAAVAPVLSPVKLIEPPMGSTTSDTVEHSSLIGASAARFHTGFSVPGYSRGQDHNRWCLRVDQTAREEGEEGAQEMVPGVHGVGEAGDP